MDFYTQPPKPTGFSSPPPLPGEPALAVDHNRLADRVDELEKDVKRLTEEFYKAGDGGQVYVGDVPLYPSTVITTGTETTMTIPRNPADVERIVGLESALLDVQEERDQLAAYVDNLEDDKADLAAQLALAETRLANAKDALE